MARNLYTLYPNNVDGSDQIEFPVGKARNETATGTKDGFPFEKEWVNEILGFLGAILSEVGEKPNGTIEKASASQYLNALKAFDIALGRLVDGFAVLTTGGLTMGTSTEGTSYLNKYPGLSGFVGATAANTKTNVHTTRLVGGGIEYRNGPGNNHKEYSIIMPISSSFITYFKDPGSDRVQISIENGTSGIDITGVNFGFVYRTELILYDESPQIRCTIPMGAKYVNNGGVLNLERAKCDWTVATGSSFVAQLLVVVDSDLIS